MGAVVWSSTICILVCGFPDHLWALTSVHINVFLEGLFIKTVVRSSFEQVFPFMGFQMIFFPVVTTAMNKSVVVLG